MDKHYSYAGDIKTRWLLLCGAIGGPLFVIVFLIAGATRANYNPLRHPISSLAIGDFGWIQVANFIITGLLFSAFSIGLWRSRQALGGSTWGPLLVGIISIGLLGAGIFVADPYSGYPPGTPGIPLDRTAHGRIHDLFSLVVFFTLPAACFVFSRRFAILGMRGWALYSALSGLAMLVTFVLAAIGFSQAKGWVDVGGLFQRISISIGWGWLTLLAIYLLRAPSQQ